MAKVKKQTKANTIIDQLLKEAQQKTPYYRIHIIPINQVDDLHTYSFELTQDQFDAFNKALTLQVKYWQFQDSEDKDASQIINLDQIESIDVFRHEYED